MTTLLTFRSSTFDQLHYSSETLFDEYNISVYSILSRSTFERIIVAYHDRRPDEDSSLANGLGVVSVA